jgi:hypothetical protein
MTDEVNENIFYVFESLNDDKMIEDEYLIATGNEAKQNVKQHTTRGIIELSNLDNDDFISRWN